MKVLTVVGTRPEIIKMARVIPALDKSFDHFFVYTNQNYDPRLKDVLFEDLSLRTPDHSIPLNPSNYSGNLSQILSGVEDLLSRFCPDAFLVYGDTDSCMSALVAKKYKVPIFHMEAGNRCFSHLVPEETNRKTLDHISDINLVLTSHARRNLLREGIEPQTIFNVGSHMKEVLSFYSKQIQASNILSSLHLDSSSYILVSLHRSENVDNVHTLLAILASLASFAKTRGYRLIFSTHPRTKASLSTAISDYPTVEFLPPFAFFDYISLQSHAALVVSDSGTISEESYLLNFPAVSVRFSHERPESIDSGSLQFSTPSPNSILLSSQLAISRSPCKPSYNPDYESVDVSSKIVRIVTGYTPWVKSRNYLL